MVRPLMSSLQVSLPSRSRVQGGEGWREGLKGHMEAIQNRNSHSNFAGIQTRAEISVLCFDL